MEMDVVHRKGIFLSLFSGLHIWNERTIVAEIQKWRTWENNKLQILQKVYKNVAPSHIVTQSAAAHA